MGKWTLDWLRVLPCSVETRPQGGNGIAAGCSACATPCHPLLSVLIACLAGDEHVAFIKAWQMRNIVMQFPYQTAAWEVRSEQHGGRSNSGPPRLWAAADLAISQAIVLSIVMA